MTTQLIGRYSHCRDDQVEVPENETPVGEQGKVLFKSPVEMSFVDEVHQPHQEVEGKSAAVDRVEPLDPPPVRQPLSKRPS